MKNLAVNKIMDGRGLYTKVRYGVSGFKNLSEARAFKAKHGGDIEFILKKNDLPFYILNRDDEKYAMSIDVIKTALAVVY